VRGDHSGVGGAEVAMASKTPERKAAKPGAPAAASVEAFLASLDHPFKPEIIALRRIILGAAPGITEGIKWNVPSFRTSEYFATTHLRGKDCAQVVLHFGAKVRELPGAGVVIADPESLLQWLAQDRAITRFRDLRDIEARGAAFADVIRQWIPYV
ncbi:MAG TPA: DUF1801 domain-containing protein, partial [Usitatibacter sp.]|nr:DUF1801 domain-containing protein [Usitatibacter sp.]